MNITYVFFHRGMKAQGIDRTKLIYHSKLQPWLSYWGIFWTSIFIFINGFSVFWDFNASDFLTHCASTLLAVQRYNLTSSPLQISTSLSSLPCTLAGRLSSAQKSGSRRRWTSSPAFLLWRRPKSPKSHQGTLGIRFSMRSSRWAYYSGGDYACTITFYFLYNSSCILYTILHFLGHTHISRFACSLDISTPT